MTDTAATRSTTHILFIAGALLAASHLANEWVKLDLPWGRVTSVEVRQDHADRPAPVARPLHQARAPP